MSMHQSSNFHRKRSYFEALVIEVHRLHVWFTLSFFFLTFGIKVGFYTVFYVCSSIEI